MYVSGKFASALSAVGFISSRSIYITNSAIAWSTAPAAATCIYGRSFLPRPSSAGTDACFSSTDPHGASARHGPIDPCRTHRVCPPCLGRRLGSSSATTTCPYQIRTACGHSKKTSKYLSPTLSTSCPASAKTLTTLPGIGEATRPVDSAAEDEAPRAARPLGLVTVNSYLRACVRGCVRLIFLFLFGDFGLGRLDASRVTLTFGRTRM